MKENMSFREIIDLYKQKNEKEPGQESRYELASVYGYLAAVKCMEEEYEAAKEYGDQAAEICASLYDENPSQWIKKCMEIINRIANCFQNKAADVQEYLNYNSIEIIKSGQNMSDFSYLKSDLEEYASQKYNMVFEMAERHLKAHDSVQDQKLYCEALMCKGFNLERENKLREAGDVYFEYVEKMLDIYQKAPYEVSADIMNGFAHPIRFWIRYHVWDDARYTLDMLEHVVHVCCECNPKKYEKHLSEVKKLENEFMEEREWGD